MHKGLHPKSYVGRLYVSRKDGRRGLMSCESTIKSEENLLQGVKHVGILKFNESVSKKDLKISLNDKGVENWKEKQMHGQFIKDVPEGTDK